MPVNRAGPSPKLKRPGGAANTSPAKENPEPLEGTKMSHDTTPAESVKIQNCFGALPVSVNDAASIADLLKLTTAAKTEHDLTHGADAKRLRAALREIFRTLPGLADQAEKQRRVAKAEARDRGDRFPEYARALLDAAKPFKSYARYHPSPRGWWHWYDRELAREVSLTFSRAGKTVSFSNATGEGVAIVADLLDLAGIEQTAVAVCEAINKGNNF